LTRSSISSHRRETWLRDGGEAHGFGKIADRTRRYAVNVGLLNDGNQRLVFLDDLRGVIWVHYDLKVIDEIRAQRLPDPSGPSGTTPGDDTF